MAKRARRRRDWADRLDRLVGRARVADYQWGRWDCGIFAIEVVRAICGRDPAPGVAGSYDTMGGAVRVHGGDLEAFAHRIAMEAGMVRVKGKFARLGDVAVVEAAHGPALGVVLGDVVAVPSRPRGLQRVSCGGILRAWRVPE